MRAARSQGQHIGRTGDTGGGYRSAAQVEVIDRINRLGGQRTAEGTLCCFQVAPENSVIKFCIENFWGCAIRFKNKRDPEKSRDQVTYFFIIQPATPRT
jgi:hypothetical protein